VECTINQLMELTGKSFRTIKAKLSKLKPVREDGRAAHYDSKEALRAIYSLSSELEQETLLLERARRQKAEIEVKELTGQLVPIEDVAKTVEREYAYVRNQIRSLPSRLAKPLSMISEPTEVFERLSDSVNECLTELVSDENYKKHADKIATEQRLSTETKEDEELHPDRELG
jgi:uncharacterized UPF0146 family protein